MGITFRHDAAAVVPPSNQSTRKYGQSLVLQQQQQKYNQQQAGYDRLFQLGRDNLQTQAQIFRDNAQNAHQVNLAKGQEAFQLDRDKQQNEWRQQQQRGADFSAARARMDAHAKDALNNPDIPPELRQKIQSLVNGKMAVLGSGFNETQQQEFLDQYNSQLAALLSEIPPKAAPPSAQDQFNKGIVTDPNTGMRYRQNSKGDYEPLPQQEQLPQKPTSPGEAFQDKKTLDDYYKKADDYITGGDPDNRPKVTENGKERPMTPQEYHAHVNKVAGDLWGIDNPQGSATAAPSLPGAAQAPASPPEMKSILETPQDMTVTPPDEGAPPSPPIPTGGQPTQAPPQPSEPPQSTAAAEYDAQMTAQGYKLVTPADGGRPYYYKDATAGQGSSTIPATPGASQNAFEEAPSTNQPAYPPSDWEELMAETPSAPPSAPPAAPAPTPASPQASSPAAEPKAAPAPDFGNMISSTRNNEERRVLNSLRGMYDGQSPEVQSAINVLLSPDSEDVDAANALEYLKSAGIDVAQLAEYQQPGGGRRGKAK